MTMREYLEFKSALDCRWEYYIGGVNGPLNWFSKKVKGKYTEEVEHILRLTRLDILDAAFKMVNIIEKIDG